MKVEVKYRCGHSYPLDAFGTPKEVEAKLGALKADACPQCQEAEEKRRAAHAAREAASWANSEGLPDLAGANGDITEAEAVRKAALEECAGAFPRLEAPSSLLLYLLTDTRRVLREETRAVWWLNNHRNPAGAAARGIAKQASDEIAVQILKGREG